MISTPFRFLKSKKLSSQKESFTKEIQVFAENLIKKRQKFEENVSKGHSPINLASKENKELIQKKVLNFIYKLSLEERIKLFTISNKWLAEVLIQLFSLYENNDKITFELKGEMTSFICDEKKCWKCGQEYQEDEYDLISYYEKNLSENKFIPFCEECGHDILNYNNSSNFLAINKETESDIFSYKLYFKIRDSLEEKEDINRYQMESEFLKYIKIVKPYDIITFDKELLLDFEKLKKFFEYFTKNNCFKDWITPTKNKLYKTFNFPKWVHKKDSLTFFQILVIFFEQHILLNYEYFFYTNRIYQTKNQETMEELYDDINSKVSQINSEAFSIEKIFTEDIIKGHVNKYNQNKKDNNDELSTQIYNELQNNIKDYNGQKEKVIKLLERLTFLDLDEEANQRQTIYESYKNYIFETLENEIADELREDSFQEKKAKKHKKSKKPKNKNIIEVAEDENEIKEDIKEESKEDSKEESKEEIKEGEEKSQDDLFSDRKTISMDSNAENENKICVKQKEEKYKEFFLFTNLNKSKKKKKKKKPAITKKKKANLIEKINADFDDKLVRIISKTSLSTYKSSNNKDENEDCSSIISGMTENIIQVKDKLLESSLKKDLQNTTNSTNNNNVIQNFNINNNNCNYNNPTSCTNFNLSQFYNWYNNFYDKGFDKYCKITQKNVSILYSLKRKYFKIIIDEIIKKNLKDRYDLKFKFYGSSCTGLAIEGSDSDCCIFSRPLTQKNEYKFPFYAELLSLLKDNQQNREDISYTFKDIFDTSKPRIIVTIDIRNDLKKCPLNNKYQYLGYDDMSYIKLDFTFTEEKEYLKKLDDSIQYVKQQLEEFPPIRPVLLVLKRYFKNKKMNEIYKGGISPYSLFLLLLNIIYIYLQQNPNCIVKSSQLLFLIFSKFSFFNFGELGIGKYNIEYALSHENSEEKLYIIDPLTGKNVAENGCLKGKELKATFYIGYYHLQRENVNFIQSYNNDRPLLNKYSPIVSIVRLINS